VFTCESPSGVGGRPPLRNLYSGADVTIAQMSLQKRPETLDCSISSKTVEGSLSGVLSSSRKRTSSKELSIIACGRKARRGERKSQTKARLGLTEKPKEAVGAHALEIQTNRLYPA